MNLELKVEKNFYKKRMQSIFLSSFFTLMVWSVMATSVRKGLPFWDAGLFEYFGYAMTKGDIPYINIFDHKGPFIFIVNFLGYTLGGPLGIKCLYLLSIFSFFSIAFSIGSLFASTTAIFFVDTILYFVLIVYFEGGWGIEGYVLPFITYTLYLFIKYLLNLQLKKKDIFILGFSFAVVALTKVNMIGVWIVFALFLFFDYVRDKKFQELVYVILYFSSGAIIFILPVFFYLGITNSLHEMFYQSISLNLLYSIEVSEITLVQMFGWYYSVSNIFYMNVITVISTFILSKQKKKLSRMLFLTFSICLFLAIISRRKYLHYLVVLIPFYVPYISILLGEVEKYFLKNKIFLYASVIFILFSNNFELIKKKWDHRYDNRSVSEELVGLYIQEKTNIEERIYAHRVGGIIYLHSDRLSSTRFFFVPAFSDVLPIYELFKESFESNPPTYIVYRKESEIKTIIDLYVKETIDKKYKLEVTIEGYEIYRRE